MPAQTQRSTRPVTSENEYERLPVLVYEDASQMAHRIARKIAGLAEEKRAVGDHLVLGLPPGSTPIYGYRELIRMHREEGLDLSNVVTFNVDEYYPIDPKSIQSHHRYMHENLFDHVNIRKENIHIPDGTLPREEVETFCLQYEDRIRKAGGIDLLLLGIGRSGGIGFNEPGSAIDARTRLVVLDEITRRDAARAFFNEANVPREAITMGIGTIMEAREIILMAVGEHKASIIRRAAEEEPSRSVAASYLQQHHDAAFYVDRSAASELTRVKTPWLIHEVEWDAAMAKRAVIWVARKEGKPIPRLDASDFHRNHLYNLLHRYGRADDLCRAVFEDIRTRVTFANALPKKQRIVVFSPHPEDDVIAIGGMLRKLHQNGNDITIAYMTNGSVAVSDEDVRRHLQFVELASDVLSIRNGRENRVATTREHILRTLSRKKPGEVDLPEVQQLKANIRYTEALAAIEVLGFGPENARFLDLPFYKTGRVRKDPVGEADVQIVLNLLNETRPEHIFVAGDLADPHGTHRMCYMAVRGALHRYVKTPGPDDRPKRGRRKTPSKAGPAHPLIWLYRGSSEEWEIESTDVFVPLSKGELDLKIDAIYKHESQKDNPLFPGAYDDREFWKRARDRNIETAAALDDLGLSQFYAAEAFVTTKRLS